ncbi:MAG: DUF4198 domain-containing protein, partial [Campylobacterales bacterium]|nr:DUF4198 domain-containing protein [Campylobacterales bacterium]
WGHSIPVDDILNSPNGRVVVESFTVTSPKGKVSNLKIPTSEIKEPILKEKNFDVYTADVALQKIALKKASEKGVYKISAITKPSFYTQFIDTKGRERLKMKSQDKIKNIKTVLMSVKYQAFATSYLAIEKWKQPKATNKGLEIIPKTDLSNLRVGDLVEFQVLFYGKPLSASAKSMEFITGQSNSFGQKDHFALFSYIKDGKAQFRVQSAGQWIVSTNHKEDVTKKGKLKDLYKKVNQVYHGSTLTFNVKE